MFASTRRNSWAACYGAVSYLAFSVHSASEVYAQTPLPAVTVDEPSRQTVRRPPAQRSTGRARETPRRVAAPLPQPVAPVPYLTPATGALGAPPAPYAGGMVAT